jgi:hypothetical protein
MAEIAATKNVLRQRVRRLLQLDWDKNECSELQCRILPFLNSLGDAALIGGAIRDLARAGRKGFSSDLDFVIYGSSHARFLDAIAGLNVKPNRFGGYAIQFVKWKVDVWHIEDTWARTAGLCQVEQLSDLLKCTFFDWDSIIYDLRTGQLTFDPGYLHRLRAGVMNVRLEKNPNPKGTLVRALRRAALWQVRFGRQLSAFTRYHLDVFEWDELVKTDKAAFGEAVLAYLDRTKLMQQLQLTDIAEDEETTFPVPHWEREPRLPFGHADRSDLSPCP